jgi:hypothetical protein
MAATETRGGDGPGDWQVVPEPPHKDGSGGPNPAGSVVEGDGVHITGTSPVPDGSPNPGGSVLDDAGVVIAGDGE